MNLQLPTLGGVALGLFAALAAATVPSAMLESLVDASGVAALLPVAEPPLGVTARAVLALAGGSFVALVGWSALYLIAGPDGFLAAWPRRHAGDGTMPTVRRADAHPDAPPRPPFSPGAFPVVAEEQAEELAVPSNLDLPLAAFDPAAIPEHPREPVRALEPLATRMALSPGERIATFDLTPTPAIARSIADDAPPTLSALIDRLEQSGRRTVQRASRPSLEETLGSLRRLARG